MKTDRYTYATYTIEAAPVDRYVAKVITRFICERGHKPAQVLLGWETWLQLGLELRKRKDLLKPTEFLGIPIVVDDTCRQGVIPLPGLEHVRFGADE